MEPSSAAAAPEGYRAIPEIDVRASAGPGALNEGLEEAKEMWFFPDPVIRHEFRARPADLRMITIDGDSMEPLLASGDRILIDTSQGNALARDFRLQYACSLLIPLRGLQMHTI